ncbi:MAG: redoxin family protein [Planctomycetes bacterium]|nr:redoxin family protein [Planctomycetota bacterium]
MKHPMLLAAFSFLLRVPLATAQTPAPAGKPITPKEAPASTLKVGDKAPALAIEKWVKGAPVASFEKGKVYMIEFWATWCGPCIASMPHITELQKKYKEQGFTVIGVTSVDKRGNALDKVEKMVADKGDAGMGYSVAWDKERTTNAAFMQAAGQDGIPCSFLIDRDGNLAYIGHPARIDATLADVIANKHDIKALAAKFAAAKETEAKASAIQAEMNKAGRAKDWDKLIQLCDDLVKLDSEQFGGAAATKFKLLAVEKKDAPAALAYAKEVFAGFGKSDANVLNAIAWTLVDPENPLPQTDAALAIQLATRAVELTERKNAAILDTLARAHFAKGEVDKAIEIQTEAVKLDKELQGALDEYTAAKSGKKIGN